MKPLKATLLPLIRPHLGRFSMLHTARGVARAACACQAHPLLPAQRQLPTALPGTQLERFLPFLQRPYQAMYTAHYHKGWATHFGGHINASNELIAEVSLHYTQKLATHEALQHPRFFRPCYRAGQPVVSLAGKGYYNYFHWMMDLLPKLSLLQGFLKEGYALYMPLSQPFHRVTWQLLGQPTVIDSSRHHTIWAPHIAAASVTHPSETPHPSYIQFTREFGLQHCGTPAGQLPKRFFVSRQGAQARQVLNWPEVTLWCRQNDIEMVQLEDYSLVQQVQLFRDARLIVAPHGAGLTNLAFATPGTPVIEIMGDDEKYPEPPCFWAISQVVGLRHAVLLAQAQPTGRRAHEHHYHLDTQELQKLLKLPGMQES